MNSTVYQLHIECILYTYVAMWERVRNVRRNVLQWVGHMVQMENVKLTYKFNE